MFRETDVKGLSTGGEIGKGKNDGDDGDGGKDDDGDWGGGSASNVKIEGVAFSSTRLGNRLGELKGEAKVGDCWKLSDGGDTGELTDGGVPQIVLR